MLIIMGVSVQPKVRRFVIIGWPWVIRRLPEGAAEFPFSIKNSLSIPPVVRQQVTRIGRKTISFMISLRTRKILENLEPIGC